MGRALIWLWHGCWFDYDKHAQFFEEKLFGLCGLNRSRHLAYFASDEFHARAEAFLGLNMGSIKLLGEFDRKIVLEYFKLYGLYVQTEQNIKTTKLKKKRFEFSPPACKINFTKRLRSRNFRSLLKKSQTFIFVQGSFSCESRNSRRNSSSPRSWPERITGPNPLAGNEGGASGMQGLAFDAPRRLIFLPSCSIMLILWSAFLEIVSRLIFLE